MMPVRRYRGVLMGDVMLLLIVIALAVIPAAGVMTYVWQSSKKTAQTEMAIYLADQTMAANRISFPSTLPTAFPAFTTNSSQVVGGVTYQIDQKMFDAIDGPELQPNGVTTPVPLAVDVDVTVSYPDGLPVERVARIFKHVQDMEAP